MYLKLHHIGYVVENIEKFEAHILVIEKVTQVYDPVQDADLALYSTPDGPFIELIAPRSDKAFTYNFLQKNHKSHHYHHLCYEVATMEELDQTITSKKLIKILGPVKALLFDHKEVVFTYSKNKEIIEFLILKA